MSENKLYLLKSPAGKPIIGTLESLNGRCDTVGFAKRADGTFGPEFDGHTEIFWEESHPVMKDGELLVLDEDGDPWKISECVEDGEVE